MPYGTNLQNAARRHLRGASILHEALSAGAQPGGRALAGYLYGLAAELALKEIMRQSGIQQLPPTDRANDPYWKHFPELKTMLSLQLRGRRDGELRKYASNNSLFANWDIKMRYAHTNDVQPSWIAAWKKDAEDLVSKMDMP